MKNAILLIAILITTPCLAQEEIWVSHATVHFDDIEIGLQMDKPTSKFELIDIDTMTVIDSRGNVLKENKNTPLNDNYNNGRAKAIRVIAPKRRTKHLHIKGVMNYFTPTFKGKKIFGTLRHSDKSSCTLDITEEGNPTHEIYFSYKNVTYMGCGKLDRQRKSERNIK